jgi:hypothetical protein
MGLASFFDKGTSNRHIYLPGEAVPYSGLYRAMHRRRHVPDHNLTCVSDRLFPQCKECGGNVEFKLLQAVRLIDKHDLFRPSAPRQPASRQLPWSSVIAAGESEIV